MFFLLCVFIVLTIPGFEVVCCRVGERISFMNFVYSVKISRANWSVVSARIYNPGATYSSHI